MLESGLLTTSKFGTSRHICHVSPRLQDLACRLLPNMQMPLSTHDGENKVFIMLHHYHVSMQGTIYDGRVARRQHWVFLGRMTVEAVSRCLNHHDL